MKITIQEGEEKEDDLGDTAQIYEARMGNNVQTMEWTRRRI